MGLSQTSPPPPAISAHAIHPSKPFTCGLFIQPHRPRKRYYCFGIKTSTPSSHKGTWACWVENSLIGVDRVRDLLNFGQASRGSASSSSESRTTLVGEYRRLQPASRSSF